MMTSPISVNRSDPDAVARLDVTQFNDGFGPVMWSRRWDDELLTFGDDACSLDFDVHGAASPVGS